MDFFSFRASKIGIEKTNLEAKRSESALKLSGMGAHLLTLNFNYTRASHLAVSGRVYKQ
jgi:hypothetical protein